MKQIFFMLLFFTAFLFACEKELDIYDGNSGIFFNTEGQLNDTMVISWGMKPGDVKKQDLKLRVLLIGEVVDYDRKFTIDVIADDADTLKAEEGIDYEVFKTEYVIPAREAYTDIDIVLKRRENLGERSRRFTVKLNETPELQFLYSRQKALDSITQLHVDYQRVIYMNEVFPRPSWWSRIGQPRFGDWSQKKAGLICDVMGIDREEWLYAIVGEGTFTQGYLSYVGKYMHQYLQEHPVKDKNDEWMVMGPDSQN